MLLEESGLTPSSVFVTARRYYSKKNFDHAIRVTNYVTENAVIPEELRNSCIALALAHDLWEDTNCPLDEFGDKKFSKALSLLTKPKDQPYVEYIKNIKEHCTEDWGLCAWYVKLADMKDHLMQTETLTDKLKEKYLSALPYLL